MKPIAFGCQDQSHDHDMVVRSAPVADRGLLTLWRCEVHRAVGGFWHDMRTRPDSLTRGGPLR